MEEQTKKGNEDEIDLTTLIDFILKGITNSLRYVFYLIVKALVTLRKFIIEKYIYLIIGMIIGGLLGYVKINFTEPTYNTSLTLKSEFLKGYDFLYELNTLNDYLVEENYDIVADLFKASKEDVTAIKSVEGISYYNYYKVFEKMGDIEKLDSLAIYNEIESSTFVLSIELQFNEIAIKNLEGWIKNYFENNELIVENFELEQNKLTQIEKKLIQEISNLDSLKQGVYKRLFQDNPSRNNTSLEIALNETDNILKNPLDIYDKDLDLFEKLQGTRARLNSLEKIKIINGVKTLKKNRNSTQLKSILYGMFVGLIFVTVVYLLAYLNSYLDKYGENHLN